MIHPDFHRPAGLINAELARMKAQIGEILDRKTQLRRDLVQLDENQRLLEKWSVEMIGALANMHNLPMRIPFWSRVWQMCGGTPKFAVMEMPPMTASVAPVDVPAPLVLVVPAEEEARMSPRELALRAKARAEA